MSMYYTIITIIVGFSMLSMLVCVGSSGAISRKMKKLFAYLFLSVIISAFCEWLGIQLQGTGSETRLLHIAVKAIELSVAPAISFMIAGVIDRRNKKPICVFLVANAILEISSGMFGFIYYVDAESNYVHGNFYWIYIAAYVVSILYGIYIVIRNINKYQYGGITFFIMIVLFLLFGITVQMCNSELKVDYITIAVASIMLYVFTLEMIQQTDELTGLINRRGYENYLGHLDENAMILMFDVDRFKDINDRYGHPFGDFCLKETGVALKETYAKFGKCFRIGGDEFCVITTKEIDKIENLNSVLFRKMEERREKEPRFPFISVGYATYSPELDAVPDVLKTVDEMMYKYKEQHRSQKQ